MAKLLPKSDRRERYTESVRLYVAMSNIHVSDGKMPLYFIIQDSCERTVFKTAGSDELYVRYKNHAYKLYSPKSFKKVLRRAKEGKVEFSVYNGITSRTPDSLENIEPAYYCVIERSAGHFYRL